MKKLFGVFKKPWLISLLGVLALALLVWFAGPLLAFAGYEPLAGEMARMITIMVLLVLWGLNNLRRQMKADKAGKEIASGLAEQEKDAKPAKGADASGSNEEVAVLGERFDEAMVVLRKSRGKSGGHALYDLPWYIIIGPPGSGKTTALVNSGLHFPLADKFGKEALRGVGGTRNCDWWFTDEAVLLDTAGRYVTQDSDASADADAWRGFLALLRKYRRRRPINGVLVAISLSDLMTQSEREREAHVQAIRKRLQELSEHLGIRFPVYVMFTKSDLVAGFTEFYDDLGREERNQIWGMTFPLEGEPGYALFETEFDLLLGRLNDRLIARLNTERDSQRRGLIYGFPQQMASMREALSLFINETFRGSRFENALMLRGVYFTSGTQEGTPIDRIMGSLGRAFGIDYSNLASFGGQGRSYFITSLLREVVFGEQALAGANRRFERQRAWVQRGAYVIAILATIGGALAWSTSFTRNQGGIVRMQEALASYDKLNAEPVPADTDFAVILPRLNSLREITRVYGQYDEPGVPLSMGLGLYQGDMLGAGAEGAYRRELNRLLASRTAARIGEQIATTGDPDFRYEALKLYLMLADPERLDPDLLRLWMKVDWRRSFPEAVDKQGDLQEHLDALIAAGLEPAPVDQELIQSVRLGLGQVPLAQLAYGRLKREAAGSATPPFRLADVLGPDGSRVFARSSGKPLDEAIPGLFTYRGYFETYQTESSRLVDQLRKESWVLDVGGDDLSKAELDKLDQDVESLYLAEYADLWRSMLMDLRLAPINSVAEAAKVAEVLSSTRSPMRALLQAVERNTSLDKLPAGAEALAKQAGALVQARTRLEQLLQSAVGAASGEVELPGAVVSREFEEINALVRKQGDSAPPLDRLIGVIAELYGQFTAASSAQAGLGQGGVPPQPLGAQATQRIEVEAARQPEPVKTWLRQLAQGSRSAADAKVQRETAAVVSQARQKVLDQANGDWANKVLALWKQALAGRYPFVPDADREVTLIDFGRFFGPGGALDQFFSENLKPYVDTSQAQWRWKEADGISLGLSDASLRVFQQAAVIRETFFLSGGKTPSVVFALKPLELDPNITQFLLEIDGQQFAYRHGPTRASNAKWPGDQGAGGARIVFEGAAGGRNAVTVDGPWAWFRLLDRYQVRSLSADRLVVDFEAEAQVARWEIRASSVVNPFRMKELQQFDCPDRL